jgi:hypothetical protein
MVHKFGAFQYRRNHLDLDFALPSTWPRNWSKTGQKIGISGGQFFSPPSNLLTMGCMRGKARCISIPAKSNSSGGLKRGTLKTWLEPLIPSHRCRNAALASLLSPPLSPSAPGRRVHRHHHRPCKKRSCNIPTFNPN